MGPRRNQYDAFEKIAFYNRRSVNRAAKLRQQILDEQIRRAPKTPGKIVRRKRAERGEG
mgnify:CR=1 FL=1